MVVTYQYLSPNVLFEPPTTFRAGNPDLYPLNSVTFLQEQQVYIVRTAQGFYAVSAVCTHLGCITQWKPEDELIACPCHGSKFQIGRHRRLQGRRRAPLPHFAISLTADGELSVDKLEIVGADQALEGVRETMSTTSTVERSSGAVARDAGLEIRLPPRTGANQPDAQPRRLRKPVPAFPAGQSAREIPAGSGLLLSRFDLLLAFHHPGGHRRSA